VLLGGSRVPEDLPPNVVATYGMTETGSGVVYDGWALDGVEISFRPSDRLDNGELAAGLGADAGGTEGEILIRAPMLLRCYRDGDDGRVVGPDGDSDWFATGDAGRLNAEGKLIVSGRIDDVITTGAEKVWPDVLERILATHPGVAEVAIWKRTDPEWGERVVAWIVPIDGGPSLDEIRQMVTDTIAPWAAPKELVLVDDLPRTAAGKVRRRALDA
jgi:O-succinylbenzoic acid--CoA ligase